MENNGNINGSRTITYGENRIRYHSFKTEINPTKEQAYVIEDYFKMAIIAYNRFIRYNINILNDGGKIIDTKAYFDAIRSGGISESDSQRLLSSKYRTTISKTLDVASKAMKKYVSKEGNIPKYKRNGTKHISYYFSASASGLEQIQCERHRIFIPDIGWIRIKEKGYLPYKKKDMILSGWIKKNCGRYFISVLVKAPYVQEKEPNGEGIGIDLNISNFATISDGRVFANINKTENIRKLKRKLAKYNRRVNRLQRIKKEENNGKIVLSQNYKAAMHKLDAVYYNLYNVRNDYFNKCVSDIVKRKPKYIALETLIVTEIVKDKKFSKYIAEESLYAFRLKIHRKSKMNNIQIRMVDKYYPSSKICHECGFYYKTLSIDEREYICPGCKRMISRDYNASLNIRDSKKYSVWF